MATSLQTITPETTQVMPFTGGEGATGRIAARLFLYAVFKHKRLVGGVFGTVIGAAGWAG